MAETTDMTAFAASVLALIERFVGNRPDALAQMRAQVENELRTGHELVARARAQLDAIEQLENALNSDEADVGAAPPAPALALARPSLKNGIVQIIEEDPYRVWDREELYAEVIGRGWGPNSKDPRNTLTSRMRDLELEERIRRVTSDTFTSMKNEGALAM